VTEERGEGPVLSPAEVKDRLEQALFEVRRVIAGADLSTPRGRDRALAEARPVIATVPPNTATRDELVRFVADRLDVDRNYLMSQAAAAPSRTAQPAAPARAPLDAVARKERTFITMCIGSEMGREYLERLTADHFSYEPLWRVRTHLISNWDDPLIALADDDESFAVLIKDVVLRADNEEVPSEVLRLTFLQIDFARVNRELRRAEHDQDFDAQRALATERQGLRDQIDELMGLTL
jgi:DNA primase